MNDEPILSLTDVAEILQYTLEDVRDLIERGDLATHPHDRSRIEYSEIVRFIDIRNHERLTLGLHDTEPADFVMLRPRRE